MQLEEYIAQAPICAQNKLILKTYLKECTLNNLSYVRVYKKILMLAQIGKEIGDFKKLSRPKAEKWFLNLKGSKYATHTKHDYVAVLKQFMKWLAGGNKYYPESVEWMHAERPKPRLAPSDIITDEEFTRLISACRNLRDIAFLQLLREGGPRIAEIMAMRIKDVEFIDRNARVRFPEGKTGPRTILVIRATASLARWISMHPLQDDPEAWLWINEYNRQHWDRGAIRMEIKRISYKAKLKRRIYPHLFRHTCATELARKGWSEREMELYLGWTIGSDMPATYIHLTARDLDKRTLERYGLKTEGKQLEPEVVTCPSCHTVQPSSNKKCQECQMTLDLKEAQKLLQEAQRTEKYAAVMAYVLKNHPEVLQEIEKGKNKG